jgi:hypothetical protein
MVFTVTSPASRPAASARALDTSEPVFTSSTCEVMRSTRTPSAVVASWNLAPSAASNSSRTDCASLREKSWDSTAQVDPPSNSRLSVRPRVNRDTMEPTTRMAETTSRRLDHRGKSKSFRPW